MVLIDDIKIGQIIEVLKSDKSIHLAKVRFKGYINGRHGDWVGLEMASKVGNSDGMIQGRRYFIVLDGYGLFTRPDKIRFISISRNSSNNYRSLKDSNGVKDDFESKVTNSKIFENKVTISKEYIKESFLLDNLLNQCDNSLNKNGFLGYLNSESIFMKDSRLKETKSKKISNEIKPRYNCKYFIPVSSIPCYSNLTKNKIL